jgi:replication factor C small subunit
MSKYDFLWVEKYRPQTFKDIILNDDTSKFFANISEETPHLLLWGNAGTGKTTLAKIIVNDLLKCQYLYINASDENGVDTIRNKVTSFSQTKSFDGKKKVIILDEADGLTNEGQRILRNVMEKYAENARFILTANYFSRIIEPICSRCLIFNLKPDFEKSYDRCLMILEKENVQLEETDKKSLKIFLEKRYPDLRRTINDLQKYALDKNFLHKEEKNTQQFAIEIIKNLLKKQSLFDLRTLVISNENLFDSNYQQLLKKIFEIVSSSKMPDTLKKNILLEIGEHMYRDNFVLDHEINFFCCLLAIEKALN